MSTTVFAGDNAQRGMKTPPGDNKVGFAEKSPQRVVARHSLGRGRTRVCRVGLTCSAHQPQMARALDALGLRDFRFGGCGPNSFLNPTDFVEGPQFEWNLHFGILFNGHEEIRLFVQVVARRARSAALSTEVRLFLSKV